MPKPTASLADQLAAAAMALTVDPATAGTRHPLLRSLDYDDSNPEAAAHRVRMLRAAAAMRRLFRLPVPDAPGLIFFGGEADPAVLGPDSTGLPLGSLAGSGLRAGRAFEACVGEGIEYLSQFVGPSDALERGTFRSFQSRLDQPAVGFVAAVGAACGVAADQPIAWVGVQRLSDRTAGWFPADLCLRRPVRQQDFAPPLKLSTGCAAGPTREAATLRALLELIERDGVAMWWRGGRRGRAVPAASDGGRAAASLLARLRQGRTRRTTALLDITTDLAVPVVAALSTDADGFGFAFGLGARPTLPEAARAAIFELCQVELGQHVIAAKRQEAGDVALNDSDRKQLRRATTFDSRACLLLQPEGSPAADEAPLPADPPQATQAIVGRMERRGIGVWALDLTRPLFDVPVIRVLAPGLQLEPCQIEGERLRRTIAETGGGARHTGDVALL